MQAFVGIEIGGTKLQIVVGDADAKILERFRLVVDVEKGAKGIKSQIHETLDNIRLHSVSSIGIGFGGPVDHQSGKILKSYQVPGWGEFVLREWLEKLTRIPVWIDNDANVACLGEALYGAGANCRQVFYVTLGSGVGAGLVVDKKIYHGFKNSEAEFGHIRLDKSGKTVEAACSGWAVDEKTRNYSRENPQSLLSQLTKGFSRGEARILRQALEQGDEASQGIIESVTDDLAFGLSHVVHLLNTETIVIGGGLSLIGEQLRERIEQKLPGYLMDVLRPGPSIQLSALKEDAVPVGALALAIHKTIST